MIQVVNKYKTEPSNHDVYIGRGSPLGNPYTSMKGRETKAQFVCDSREESVAKYKDYIISKIRERDSKICGEIKRIHNMSKSNEVNLVCFCKPKPCHGDIILSILNTLDI